MPRAAVLLVLVACASTAPPRTAGVYVRQPYFVNFVPFGAGQLQNGDRGKGYALAVGEAVTATVSASAFVYLTSKYGVSGTVAIEDGASVRRLQQVEVGTGVAFFALYAYGVVDALRHYEPYREVRGATVVPTGRGAAVVVRW